MTAAAVSADAPRPAPPPAAEVEEEFAEPQGRQKTASSHILLGQQQSSSAAAEEAAPSSSSPISSPPQPHQQTSAATSSSSSSQVVIRRERPAVPPKPQLDIVRFSMAQARDELDLDTILNELLELENQLCGEAGDRFVLGLPSLPPNNKNSNNNAPQQQQPSLVAAPVEQMAKRVHFHQFSSSATGGHNSTDSATAMTRLSSAAVEFCASPDADSAFGDSSSTESAHPPAMHASRIATESSGSDGNGGQQLGGGGGRNSEFSSAESFRGSLLNTPSPSHQQQSIVPAALNGLLANAHQTYGPIPSTGAHPSRPFSSADSYASSRDEQQKKAKIREALEKMKEAKMKKVFVKIFLEDGSQRGLLIDERWTVAETMRQLADKLGRPLVPEHAVVEEYPHLHIKRNYEDHELVVENLEDWTADSPNKLHFVRLPQKWLLFQQPELFLLDERSRGGDHEFPPADRRADWDTQQRHRLLEPFLQEEGGSRVPELEGWLLLKADGKKSWRRHFFVLRASGLYFVAKPGKPRGPTRDLQCLMSGVNSQVYTCTDWRKKYKAPTDWGFAIKHPRIQVKTSKYIKYICAEDEPSFLQWLNALRIVKNGCPTLFKNFCLAQSCCQRGGPGLAGPSTPVRVEVPQVPLQQRLSAMELSSSQSPRRNQQQKQMQLCFAPHQQPIGCFSPATVRASFAPSSRASGDSRLGSPIRVAFEQDQCNTIKRQPDLLAMSSHRQMELAALRHSEVNFRLGTPTTSSAGTLNGVGAESDSDEEQFPPPPGADASFQIVESPRRAIRAPFPAPMLPMLSADIIGGSPCRAVHQQQQQNNNNNKMPPPPPPPKRSEGTRLHSSAAATGCDGGGGEMRNNNNIVQRELMMAELQAATNRQKLRLEQNL